MDAQPARDDAWTIATRAELTLKAHLTDCGRKYDDLRTEVLALRGLMTRLGIGLIGSLLGLVGFLAAALLHKAGVL